MSRCASFFVQDISNGPLEVSYALIAQIIDRVCEMLAWS